MPTRHPLSFVAIVVLYRVAPDQAPTLRTLGANEAIAACRRVVVIDHGPARQDAAFSRVAASFEPGVAVYEHHPRNPPLGVAYNAAIDAHLGDADYALILDQDSCLPQTFVAAALDAAAAHAAPTLMAPHVLANGRIASPCRLLLGWGRRWRARRQGWQSLRANTLINSGAWLHRRVFDVFGLRYSETLLLYGTDTDLFRRLGGIEPRFLVLPLEMAHDLSFDTATVEDKVRKLDAMLAANRVIYAGAAPAVRWGVRCMNALVRLKYAVQYGTPRFL